MPRQWFTLLSVAVIVLIGLSGCTSRPDSRFVSPYDAGYAIAVVPFRNQSGSTALDVLAVTDEFYAELQQVKGPPDMINEQAINVLPVNRVLAALQTLGIRNVSTPEEAILLANHVGVDAVIVGSVTKYDPYPPPQMGMILQIYARDSSESDTSPTAPVDPGRLARSPRPVDMPVGAAMKPRNMVIQIFDASQTDTINRMKAYAKQRSGDESPYDWRKFTTSRNFIRFVCHEMICELISREQ